MKKTSLKWTVGSILHVQLAASVCSRSRETPPELFRFADLKPCSQSPELSPYDSLQRGWSRVLFFFQLETCAPSFLCVLDELQKAHLSSVLLAPSLLPPSLKTSISFLFLLPEHAYFQPFVVRMWSSSFVNHSFRKHLLRRHAGRELCWTLSCSCARPDALPFAGSLAFPAPSSSLPVESAFSFRPFYLC